MKTVRFGDLMKHSYSAKPCKLLCYLTSSDEVLKNDIRFKYFMSCRDNKTTVLPILHKIQADGCLNLTNYTLSAHLAKSLGQALKKGGESGGGLENAFTKLILDTNGLKDEDFAAILSGFSHV
jgi:hypothetical protein